MFIVASISVFAKPCTTDIYFGNGIWNTKKQAEKSRKALKIFMQYKAITPLSIEDEKNQLYSFKLAYNYSTGALTDLIETYWQLRESGQISEGYFQIIAATLATNNGASSHEEILEQIRYVVAYESANIKIMYQLYNNASFSQKHNVLLVAHSQGNLFGNKMYTLMNDVQKSKFRMVSVATPANSVAGGGPYVTTSLDYVINTLPNALPGNVDGVGHTFVGTYLNDSINAPKKIALYVKSAYDNLIQTTNCTEGSYSYYVWIGYQCPRRSPQELIIDIYGLPVDAPHPYNKQLVTSDSRIQMPYETKNGNEVCTISGNDVSSWWSEYDKEGCYAYSLDDNHPTGTHTFDYIASTTYYNDTLCTKYQMNSEIADELSSMLP